AMFGRNGDSPLPVIAACTPGDCFTQAMEAVRLAVEFMTPVILLTDGYLANGAEPWLIPRMADMPPIKVQHPEARTPISGNGYGHGENNGEANGYKPYQRNDKGARP